VFFSAFIFEPGDYDEELYTLDDQIHEAAASIGGFLGRESWQSQDGERKNATCYSDNQDSL
jgi:hypothetical protein